VYRYRFPCLAKNRASSGDLPVSGELDAVTA